MPFATPESVVNYENVLSNIMNALLAVKHQRLQEQTQKQGMQALGMQIIGGMLQGGAPMQQIQDYMQQVAAQTGVFVPDLPQPQGFGIPQQQGAAPTGAMTNAASNMQAVQGASTEEGPNLSKIFTPEMLKSVGLPENYMQVLGNRPQMPTVQDSVLQAREAFSQMHGGYAPEQWYGGDKEIQKMVTENWKQAHSDWRQAQRDWDTNIRTFANNVASGLMKDVDRQKRFADAVKLSGIRSRQELDNALIKLGVSDKYARNRIILSSGLTEGRQVREEKRKEAIGKTTYRNITLRNKKTGQVVVQSIPVGKGWSSASRPGWEIVNPTEEKAYQGQQLMESMKQGGGGAAGATLPTQGQLDQLLNQDIEGFEE